jgi:hypothetical protein
MVVHKLLQRVRLNFETGIGLVLTTRYALGNRSGRNRIEWWESRGRLGGRRQCRRSLCRCSRHARDGSRGPTRAKPHKCCRPGAVCLEADFNDQGLPSFAVIPLNFTPLPAIPTDYSTAIAILDVVQLNDLCRMQRTDLLVLVPQVPQYLYGVLSQHRRRPADLNQRCPSLPLAILNGFEYRPPSSSHYR